MKDKNKSTMFASQVMKGVSRTGMRAVLKAGRPMPKRSGYRQMSTKPSGYGQPDSVPIGIATAGLTLLLILGRGGKAEGSVAPADLPLTPDEAVKADLSLEARVSALEKELATMQAVGKNRAFVFIKPHAVTEKVDELVQKGFEESGISIVKEGALTADVIDKNLLIDTHYGAIASKAVKLAPSELNVPAKGKIGFNKMFGLSWSEALQNEKVYNAKEACEKLGVDGEGLELLWRKLERGKNLIKFGGGFYCGGLEVNGEVIYVINGFYMSMRSKYTTPPASLKYYLVEWSPSALSWEDFRGKVLGATDPTEAAKGSLRRKVLENWQALGLSSKPNTGDNGIHASASPFEAFAERVNWTGEKIEDDPFGKAILMSGIPKGNLVELMGDAQVAFKGGNVSIFDLLEDIDSDECLSKLLRVCKP